MRWICVILCLFLSSTSLAQSSVDRRDAVSMIEKGNFAFETGTYEEALLNYERAFRASPDPRILYRIGLTYEALGNYQRAREHLELYLQQNPSHENNERIQKKVEELRLAEVDQSFLIVRSLPEGSEVSIGESVALGVTPIRLALHPGTHLIRVKHSDRWMERQVMIGRAETVTEEFELDLKPEKEEAPAEEVWVPEEEPKIPAQDKVIMSHVSFAPPAALNALGWTGLIGGFWLGAVGVIIGDGRMIGGGLGMMGLGGYTIFIHDWTNQLPDAPISEEVGVWSLEFQVRF